MINYVWEVFQKKAKLSKVRFKPVFSDLSPYMEVQNIKKTANERIIEVNLYYRFYKIFGNLNKDNGFVNLILHMVSFLDLQKGINKRDIIKENILIDNIDVFNVYERDIVLSNILKLYQNGNQMICFTNVISSLWKTYYFYKIKERKEFILVLGANEKENKIKVDIIKDIFFPFDHKLTVLYQYHFGIVGNDNSMKIDEIMIIN